MYNTNAECFTALDILFPTACRRILDSAPPARDFLSARGRLYNEDSMVLKEDEEDTDVIITILSALGGKR